MNQHPTSNRESTDSLFKVYHKSFSKFSLLFGINYHKSLISNSLVSVATTLPANRNTRHRIWEISKLIIFKTQEFQVDKMTMKQEMYQIFHTNILYILHFQLEHEQACIHHLTLESFSSNISPTISSTTSSKVTICCITFLHQ